MATRTLENVTVSDAYLTLMADRGVEYLFANAGTDFAPMIEALAKAQALGVKLANRDTLVIGTEGDGAYMYNVPVSAHYVSAEQQLPVLWVVFNNQRWQAVRNATLGLNPDGYAASTERAPLTYFTVEQHYNKLVEVSGGYGERVTEARQMLPALERAMKAVLVEKRQALLNVVCDVDTNAGGD